MRKILIGAPNMPGCVRKCFQGASIFPYGFLDFSSGGTVLASTAGATG